MRVLACSLLALLVTTSCSSLSREPEGSWQQAEVKAPSDRVLWKVSLLSLEKMGFPLAGGLDASSGQITTGWKTNLQPFSKKGYRQQAEVALDPISPGNWTVKTRVKTQINKAIVNPLDPSRAEWEWSDDDASSASVLLQHIRSFFGPEIEFEEETEDPLQKYLDSQGLESEGKDVP